MSRITRMAVVVESHSRCAEARHENGSGGRPGRGRGETRKLEADEIISDIYWKRNIGAISTLPTLPSAAARARLHTEFSLRLRAALLPPWRCRRARSVC